MFKLTDMPNQGIVLVGSHTDFSLFITNPALIGYEGRILMKFPILNIQTRYLSCHLKSGLSLLHADVNILLMVEPLW